MRLSPGACPSQASRGGGDGRVSFTAVPANRAKALIAHAEHGAERGKIGAAMMLKRKMTLMAWAISSSSHR